MIVGFKSPYVIANYFVCGPSATLNHDYKSDNLWKPINRKQRNLTESDDMKFTEFEIGKKL